MKYHVNIRSSFENTMVLITGENKDSVGWFHFNLPHTFREQKTAEIMESIENYLPNIIRKHNISKVDVVVKGPGRGREIVLKSMQNAGLDIEMIKDITPIPHNGCRPVKRRRNR